MRILGCVILLGLAGCQSPHPPAAHSQPAAVVEQISDELELASIKLTPQAEKRLGITVVPAKKVDIANRRPYPGVVVVPPENLAVLLAPVTGTVSYLGPPPLATVSRGERLVSFAPLLPESYSPVQQEQARASRLTVQQSADAIQTRINNAEVELEASRVDLRRAEQLFQQQVGSRKRVDDARARAQLAQENLRSAQREQQTVQRVITRATVAPASVTAVAPLTGTLTKVQVTTGQSVSAGQPLLEVTDLSKLWVRVRIPQGEARDVVRHEPASINGRTARPTTGPRTGDQLTATQDLYFQVRDTTLNPDQRVEVSLPLRGSGQHLVVPTAAVLYDVYGGAWVYVRTAPQNYRRNRVLVDHTDGQAVLTQGPEVGTPVVVHGAAELFGIEFGND